MHELERQRDPVLIIAHQVFSLFYYHVLGIEPTVGVTCIQWNVSVAYSSLGTQLKNIWFGWFGVLGILPQHVEVPEGMHA